jgi:hypothetical protein
MSIFNAEAVAILEAIKATKKWGLAKKIILTDSLSTLMAQEKICTKERGANLKIIWTPAHVGIGGNKCADRAAKDALEQEVATTHKVGKLDCCRWVKEEFKRKGQNDWSNSGNTMVATLWWQLNRMLTDTGTLEVQTTKSV